MGLTAKFDTRLQDVLMQNKHLKAKVEQLQVVVVVVYAVEALQKH